MQIIHWTLMRSMNNWRPLEWCARLWRLRRPKIARRSISRRSRE
uniref:Uncharacterized protein n=1 Tax=Phlebotomus papatasi TaxID=29031 RepID=A0A1B0DR00_PHLPP